MQSPVPRARRGNARALAWILVVSCGGASPLAAERAADLDPSATGSGGVVESVEPRPAGRGRIRLATFNVAWLTGEPGVGYVPRSKEDLDRVARTLRGTHAHLICLQEVIDERALEVLAEAMNRLARGQAEFDWRLEDGTAILSPPGEREHNQRLGLLYDSKVLRIREARFLEELAEDSEMIRAPLLARVDVRDAPLDFDFVGLHLKSGMLADWAREIRAREVEILLKWIDEGRQGRDPDLVVMGDFNAARDDETLQALDARADAGDLVAIEDHLVGEATGTHIPWEVGIDRGFMTRGLWKKAGVPHGASIYRFDDFMPAAHEVGDFCIRGRRRIRKKSQRCDCGDAEGSSAGEDAEEDWTASCGGEPDRWRKAANFVRISDHRPLLWDLRLPRRRRRR